MSQLGYRLTSAHSTHLSAGEGSENPRLLASATQRLLLLPAAARRCTQASGSRGLDLTVGLVGNRWVLLLVLPHTAKLLRALCCTKELGSASMIKTVFVLQGQHCVFQSLRLTGSGTCGFRQVPASAEMLPRFSAWVASFPASG